MATSLPQRCLIPLRHTYCPKRNLFRKTKANTHLDPFIIVRPTTADTSEIIDLMWQSYYPDEPATHAIGLGRKRNCVFDESARKKLAKGYSLVAKCKYGGGVLGAALNEVTSPWDPDMTEKFACNLKDPAMARLYMFWAYLQRAPNLWEKYCEMQIFEISNIFTREDFRKKGLAAKLIKESLDLGADAGFRLLRVDATSVYTAKICDKLGMQLVYEVPYSSYVNDKNDVIFKVRPPHESVKTYVRLPHSRPLK